MFTRPVISSFTRPLNCFFLPMKRFTTSHFQHSTSNLSRTSLRFHTNFNHNRRCFSQTTIPNPGGNTVKKAGKIGLYLLIGGALLTSVSIYAHEHQPFSVESSKPMIFSPVEGIQWVEKCVEQHPEILWLADTHVRKTEEGLATLQGTYSEQLFGQKYIEFDRTIMTIHCLKLILDGSDKAYLTFTTSQPKDVRLLRESFDALHLQGQKLLKSKWRGMSLNYKWHKLWKLL